GRYEPQFLYNSWHFGGVMTRWSDLQLDGQGRPTVLVGLGSHSARALAPGENLPSGFNNGVTLRGGDGEAIATGSGQDLGQQLGFFTTQAGVANAQRFDTSDNDL